MVDTIFATERSTEPISRALFRRLEESRAFTQLVSDGVVGLLRSQVTPYGVRASCLVGQALLEGSLRLVIREKSPGALRALLRWSVPEDFRESDLAAAVAAEGELIESFGRRFVAHLGSYLAHGRAKAYRPALTVSAAPRGRIDLRETARLYSKARRGRIATRSSVLTADLLPNRLLRLGLIALRAWSAEHPGRYEWTARARSFEPVFADVATAGLERVGRRAQASAFGLAMRERRAGLELRRALAYARAIVLHLGVWPETEWETDLPHSFFINLESLFEDAVRQVVVEVASPAKVVGGGALRRPLFPDLPDRYLADPDIVIAGAPGRTAVADCKYKDLSGQPAHSDVYQLAAHCGALDAKCGLLFYPGEPSGLRRLGRTATGVDIFWCTVRPASLRDDVSEVLQTLPSGPSAEGEG